MFSDDQVRAAGDSLDRWGDPVDGVEPWAVVVSAALAGSHPGSFDAGAVERSQSLVSHQARARAWGKYAFKSALEVCHNPAVRYEDAAAVNLVSRELSEVLFVDPDATSEIAPVLLQMCAGALLEAASAAQHHGE